MNRCDECKTTIKRGPLTRPSQRLTPAEIIFNRTGKSFFFTVPTMEDIKPFMSQDTRRRVIAIILDALAESQGVSYRFDVDGKPVYAGPFYRYRNGHLELDKNIPNDELPLC